MGDLVQTWWVWISAALLLGILEVMIPAYFFLGFAIGALLLGLAAAIGAIPSSSAAIIALFSVLSLLAYIGLRLSFRLHRGDVKVWDRDINDD